MRTSQGANRLPCPLQRDRQDDKERCWSQTNSLGAGEELKVLGMDLYDRFQDNVLHDEEDGSRRGRGMIKDKPGAFCSGKCLQL